MKRKKCIYTALFLLFLCLITLRVYIAYKNIDRFQHVTSNEELSYSTNFSIPPPSSEIKTSIIGTIFVYKSGEKESRYKAQIVARFEIDKNDRKGISIYVPRGTYIKKVNSSYPEEPHLLYKDDVNDKYGHVAVFLSEYGYDVQLATPRVLDPSSRGGTGTLLIDLEIEKEKSEHALKPGDRYYDMGLFLDKEISLSAPYGRKEVARTKVKVAPEREDN